VDELTDAVTLLVYRLVFATVVLVLDTIGVDVAVALAVAVAGALPGIVSLVPANIVLPPLYLGLVVRTGLAFLMAATVVPLALAIEESV
jgi:hypothetical protein